ncbi:MAG: PBECR2 nuclease fold domain-containing protein [Oligoflexia bacterium]|nr:PBECR2 nuclease fold domain-containing protein [Oligoflexia bacterium]
MKRSSNKKAIERRKRSRGRKAGGRTQSSRAKPASNEICANCSKDLTGNQRALFVEEEVGRIFCSEDCIATFFTPEIERLEKEYYRRLSPSDLPASERESLAHLRWITIQEPDEVWREKTLTGDYRYTLISEFQPGNKKIWSVCICLFLRGEPSFLYLAFPTRNAAMVNSYRRGERVQWIRPAAEGSRLPRDGTLGMLNPQGDEQGPSDRLADSWTEDETYRAQISQERRSDDIPAEEFELYHGCVEETLSEPDEVWSVQTTEDPESPRIFHFIRHYPDDKPAVWYVIVARELVEEEQIEILDAFPTRDSGLVERYRRGEREVGGETEVRPASRVVH